MVHKPTFHHVDDREVLATGSSIQDDENIEAIATGLLNRLPESIDWTIAASSIWHTIADRWHREFIDILRTRDAKGLAAALHNIHATSLLKGIDQSEHETKRFRMDQDAADRFLVETKSLLARLAEALGVLELEVDPRYRPPHNIYLPVPDIVQRIQDRLGIDISPPRIGHGRFGLQIGPNSVITNRDLYALYAAVRCRDLAQEFSLSPNSARILEIGGGMGRTAYYLSKLGYQNVALVDLPQISLVQAYFLERSLPAAVHYGTESVPGNPGIQVYSEGIAALRAHDRGSIDLIINSDSLPEMGWQVSDSYVQAIANTCRGCFLSINQESRKAVGEADSTQAVVPELACKYQSLRRVYRFPFWLRVGYAEELYRIQRGPYVQR